MASPRVRVKFERDGVRVEESIPFFYHFFKKKKGNNFAAVSWNRPPSRRRFEA